MTALDKNCLPEEDEVAELEGVVEVANELVEDVAVGVLVFVVVGRVDHRAKHVVDRFVQLLELRLQESVQKGVQVHALCRLAFVDHNRVGPCVGLLDHAGERLC